MRYTFADFLEDARRVLTSRVVRIVVMLAAFKLLAMWGLPDQSGPLADGLVNAVDYLLLAAIAYFRVDAKTRIEVGPNAARRRRQAQTRGGVETPATL